jgi:APA family basic amino acid/polyamine antiporter
VNTGPQLRPSQLREPIRRRVGSPVLWGLVQASIAGGFYFSLGLVAQRAHGWTWIVYLAAALFFVLTAASYVEGASLHQERGGATIIARYAFNELWSFVAGWAIMLDYLILIALTAFATTNYLAVFWKPFGHGPVELIAAAGVIGLAATTNIRGIDPKRYERFFVFALGDLLVQVLLLILGIVVIFNPRAITDPTSLGGAASARAIVSSLGLAVVAFTALDASSGFAGQVAVGRKGLKKLFGVRTASMLVAYVGLALLAASAPRGPARALDAPVIGLIDTISQSGVREPLRYLVALSAALVLVTACIGAMLGLSRLGYNLAVNRQIPSRVGRLHPRFKTPVVLIVIGAVLSLALAAPEDTTFLGAIYAFGATLAFTLVHLSVLRLRQKEPDRDRPFRIPFEVRVRGTAYPLSAVAGALASLAAFASVVWLHDSARIVGAVWMAAGLVLYITYRTGSEKPLTRRLTVPEGTLTRSGGPRAEYGSILVPIFGTPLDDDIVQTAGRLAAEEREDEEEEGAQIEAMWVFEVPMSLPLDGRLPESELKRARAALKRAKAIGEEYEGVEVAPFTVRARNAGQAIVREARRRGVEAIVMPAEEPTRVRGGVLYGGKEGLHSTFVGDTTSYVVNKAPCRVILTAPPDPQGRAHRALKDPHANRPGVPPPSGDPTRPMRRAADRLRRRNGRPAGTPARRRGED